MEDDIGQTSVIVTLAYGYAGGNLDLYMQVLVGGNNIQM